MPVGELGQRMSNWELCVFWPSYFQHVRDMEPDEEREG